MIIIKLNFIKKFNYDYNLPHIKSINIKIYQKYFGTNNKNKSKNENQSNNKNIYKIDRAELNNLITIIAKLSPIIKNLSKPYNIIKNIDSAKEKFRLLLKKKLLKKYSKWK